MLRRRARPDTADMKKTLCMVLCTFLFVGVLAAQTKQTAITNVRLFDGTRVVPHATVVIDGTRIAAAGAKVAVPAGATVIDGNGKTLLPGLIDAHTHVFPGSLERALRFGVTTEMDMFTSLHTLSSLRAEQARGAVTNRADIYSAGTLVTVAGRVLPDPDIQVRRRSAGIHRRAHRRRIGLHQADRRDGRGLRHEMADAFQE
jgi:hypothetical protein